MSASKGLPLCRVEGPPAMPGRGLADRRFAGIRPNPSGGEISTKSVDLVGRLSDTCLASLFWRSTSKGNHMLSIPRDESMPLIEQVREITFANTPEDDELDFIPAARALGCDMAYAEKIAETLTVRMMRAAGAI